MEKERGEKNSLPFVPKKRICRIPQNLQQTPSWLPCEELPDRKNRIAREFHVMSEGSLWLFAAAQGLGMLALNVGLRVFVS
jgi:hypothetical protein